MAAGASAVAPGFASAVGVEPSENVNAEVAAGVVVDVVVGVDAGTTGAVVAAVAATATGASVAAAVVAATLAAGFTAGTAVIVVLAPNENEPAAVDGAGSAEPNALPSPPNALPAAGLAAPPKLMVAPPANSDDDVTGGLLANAFVCGWFTNETGSFSLSCALNGLTATGAANAGAAAAVGASPELLAAAAACPLGSRAFSVGVCGLAGCDAGVIVAPRPAKLNADGAAVLVGGAGAVAEAPPKPPKAGVVVVAEPKPNEDGVGAAVAEPKVSVLPGVGGWPNDGAGIEANLAAGVLAGWCAGTGAGVGCTFVVNGCGAVVVGADDSGLPKPKDAGAAAAAEANTGAGRLGLGAPNAGLLASGPPNPKPPIAGAAAGEAFGLTIG